MAERPVVNSSPLIFLSNGGLLELLQLAGSEVVVPMAVAIEIQRRGQTDTTVQAIERTPWLTVVETPQVADEILNWDLVSLPYSLGHLLILERRPLLTILLLDAVPLLSIFPSEEPLASY